MPIGWSWDETLFRGSAPHYVQGRIPYAPGLAGALRAALDLDGTGRLLDVGCGPGVLAVTLAPLFGSVVAVDPDAGMLAEGARRAAAAELGTITWHQARAEDLTGLAGLGEPTRPDRPAGRAEAPGGWAGSFRVATFGQSLHWMDRPLVATVMRRLLEPGGAFVQIADVKTPIDPARVSLPHPPPPYDAVEELVRAYLGPDRRAGQGVLRHGTPGDELAVLATAGYAPPHRLSVPAGPPLVRTADDIVAWVWSRSSSAPHLFADPAAFEADLRRLLVAAPGRGRFAEQPPDTDVIIWRNGGQESGGRGQGTHVGPTPTPTPGS